jgi:hypothetical protein
LQYSSVSYNISSVISIPFHIVQIRIERNSYWSSITESHYSEHWLYMVCAGVFASN